MQCHSRPDKDLCTLLPSVTEGAFPASDRRLMKSPSTTGFVVLHTGITYFTGYAIVRCGAGFNYFTFEFDSLHPSRSWT